MKVELKCMFNDINLIDILFQYYFNIADFIHAPQNGLVLYQIEHLKNAISKINFDQIKFIELNARNGCFDTHISVNEYCPFDDCYECDNDLECDNNGSLTYYISMRYCGNIDHIENWIKNNIHKFIILCNCMVEIQKLMYV